MLNILYYFFIINDLKISTSDISKKERKSKIVSSSPEKLKGESATPTTTS